MSFATLVQRLDAYERLVRLDKPIGALLLLWPTLWAVWLAAEGRPSARIVIIFVLGTWLTRSAGCAVNDFADRNFDAHVERTRSRPLAAGEIRPIEALAVAAFLGLAAFGLVLFLNRFAILLSFVAVAIAVAYPFSKRVFAFPQLILGVAFGFGIPMAYAAIRDALPLECWMLLAANVCYSFAYDTEYAMVDRDDDARLGMRTSALTLGTRDVPAVMLAYMLMLAILSAVGITLQMPAPYYLGLGAAWCMMIYHYFLIRGRTREGCFKAFRHNNWVGLAIFLGIVFSYPLRLPPL
ncbi:MAG: 4-hydroxybenzoate octaprenyltransferase [Burkholderiales bacterium]